MIVLNSRADRSDRHERINSLPIDPGTMVVPDILQDREAVSVAELARALGVSAEETFRRLGVWEARGRVRILRPVYSRVADDRRPGHIYCRWIRQDDAAVSWHLRLRLKQVSRPRLSTIAFRFGAVY